MSFPGWRNQNPQWLVIPLHLFQWLDSCPLWHGSKKLLLFFLVKRHFLPLLWGLFCFFYITPEITWVREGFPGGWEGLPLDFWSQKLRRGLEGRGRCFESRNCIGGAIGSPIWVIWGGFSWLSDPRDQHGGSLGFWTRGLCGVSPWPSDPECGNLKQARLFPGPFKSFFSSLWFNYLLFPWIIYSIGRLFVFPAHYMLWYYRTNSAWYLQNWKNFTKGYLELQWPLWKTWGLPELAHLKFLSSHHPWSSCLLFTTLDLPFGSPKPFSLFPSTPLHPSSYPPLPDLSLQPQPLDCL